MRPFAETNARMIQTMRVFNAMRPHLGVIFEGRSWGVEGGLWAPNCPPSYP